MTGNGVVPCPWQNCPQGGPMRVANDIPIAFHGSSTCLAPGRNGTYRSYDEECWTSVWVSQRELVGCRPRRRPTLGTMKAKPAKAGAARIAAFTFLFAVTVARAIWFGMTVGEFVIAMVLYAALWVVVLAVSSLLRHR